MLVDNCRMVVFDPVHRKLAGIAGRLLVNVILVVILLHQNITVILLVGKDAPYGDRRPCRPVSWAGYFFSVELLCDFMTGVSRQKFMVDAADYSRLFVLYDEAAVIGFAIPLQVVCLEMRDAALKVGADAPPGIFGNVSRFFLGKGREYRKQQFSGIVHSPDVFLFKEDGDVALLKHAGIGQAILRVSGEAGNRFRDNQIDLSAAAVFHHCLKRFSALCIGAGDPFVHIDSGKLIFRVLFNIGAVII